MTVAEALKGLQDIIDAQREGMSDVEFEHQKADAILCDVLRANGIGFLADKFEQIEKWYA